jgi:hypothetical protein
MWNACLYVKFWILFEISEWFSWNSLWNLYSYRPSLSLTSNFFPSIIWTKWAANIWDGRDKLCPVKFLVFSSSRTQYKYSIFCLKNSFSFSICGGVCFRLQVKTIQFPVKSARFCVSGNWKKIHQYYFKQIGWKRGTEKDACGTSSQLEINMYAFKPCKRYLNFTLHAKILWGEV